MKFKITKLEQNPLHLGIEWYIKKQRYYTSLNIKFLEDKKYIDEIKKIANKMKSKEIKLSKKEMETEHEI